MRFLVLAALLAGVVAAFSEPAPTAAARHKRPVSFVPEPVEGGPRLDGETWKFDGDGYGVQLQWLNDEQRLRYIRHRTGFETDPFRSRPDEPPKFATFLLIVDNHSQGRMQFNPQNCWLMPNNKRLEVPLDLPKIRSTFRMTHTKMPPIFEHLGRVLLDGEQVLGPGETRSGLLVYNFTSPRTRRFTVDVPLTLAEGEGATFKVSYRRQKE